MEAGRPVSLEYVGENKKESVCDFKQGRRPKQQLKLSSDLSTHMLWEAHTLVYMHMHNIHREHAENT